MANNQTVYFKHATGKIWGLARFRHYGASDMDNNHVVSLTDEQGRPLVDLDSNRLLSLGKDTNCPAGHILNYSDTEAVRVFYLASEKLVTNGWVAI